jgi:hypothetical protein
MSANTSRSMLINLGKKGDVGNLGPHFEHDPFNATSDRKIATGRPPRRHR